MESLDLTQIKKAIRGATRGPWYWNDSAGTDYLYGKRDDGAVWPVLGARINTPHGYLPVAADADFIANARTWLPQLVEEVERLRDQQSPRGME